jgi:hypothetical protein
MMLRTLAQWSPDTLDDLILTKRIRDRFLKHISRLDAQELMSMFLVGAIQVWEKARSRVSSQSILNGARSIAFSLQMIDGGQGIVSTKKKSLGFSKTSHHMGRH